MTKPNIKKLVLLNIPYVFAFYFADKVAFDFRTAAGGDLLSTLSAGMTNLSAAFRNPLPSFNLQDLLIGVGAALLLRLLVYVKAKNRKKFRQGIEYGSARWGTSDDIKPYIDPSFQNNVILTQTERLTMDSRPNNIRRYPDGWGETHPLSGLLYCADCGGKMYVHRTNNGKRIAQFTCAEYSKIPVGERCKSQHRIGAEVVLKLISEALKEIVTFSEQDEEAFRKVVRDTLTAQQSTESKDQEKRLAACRSRMSELETMLCKIYEDNTLGKLPNKRYMALDAQYTHEQQELEAEVAALQTVVDMSGNEERSAAKFIALVKRYQGFDEMTTTMLNEFVEKVLIHERDIKGCRDSPQTIEIYFNFIGKFRTPDSTVPLTAEEQIKDEALLTIHVHPPYITRKASVPTSSSVKPK